MPFNFYVITLVTRNVFWNVVAFRGATQITKKIKEETHFTIILHIYSSVPVWNKLKHNRVDHEHSTQPPKAQCRGCWLLLRMGSAYNLSWATSTLSDASGPQQTLMLLKHRKHRFQNIWFVPFCSVVPVYVTCSCYCDTGYLMQYRKYTRHYPKLL